MKKKTLRKVIIWLVILAAAAVGILYFGASKSSVNFKEETARTQDIEIFFTFSGNVEADSYRIVTAMGRGTIREWKFAEGDKVEKDDVVMQPKSGAQAKAPMDGTISDIYLDPDDTYNIGDALFRVADYDHPLIRIRVDEYDISAVEKDMQVEVKVQATGKKLTGTVRRIAQEATVANDLAYYEVIIDVPQDGSLVMGLTCEVSIPRESVQSATTVSVEAIQYAEDGKPFVYCYNRNDEVVKQSVLVGVSDGTIVEIKDGIRTGEVVLIPPSSNFPMPMMQMMNR